MRQTLLSFLKDFTKCGSETVFAHQPELRVIRWSGRQVAQTACQFARYLEERGINKGDRVLLWAKNSPEWIAAFFGCLLRGVIVVPLDAQNSSDFVTRIQQQTEPKLLLHSDAVGENFKTGLTRLKIEELCAIVAPHSSAPYDFTDISEDDIVEIIYTSGTTADPKGVCLTHKNLLTNIVPLERGMQKYLKWEWLIHPMGFLNLLPLSHIFGQFMGLFVPQLLSGTVFFQDSLNPSQIIETVKRERISVIVTVPRLLETLREKLERDIQGRGESERFQKLFAEAEGKHFLKRWWQFREVHRQFGWKFWAFVVGGATLDEERENFWHRLGYLIVQGYGMTETAALVSFNNPFKTTRGSIGKPFASQEIKLDESGEILVRGDNVSQRYWNQDGQGLAGNQGWLRTGDIGEMDEAGTLYFKGRKKDVIVTAAGLNIYPEDIEAELNRQPEVRDSAVIGADSGRGPEPVAVLLLADEQASPEAIVKRANQKLSDYQQVRRWLVWPQSDFPRTTTTKKIRKRDVAQALQAYLSGASQPQATTDMLAETFARVSGQAVVQLDASATLTTDLKLDSLARVELLSAIEDRYQVELDEAAFTAATTVGDLERMIQQSKPLSPSRPYPFADWPYRWPATWIRSAALYLLILPVTRLLGWVKVHGKEHLQNAPTPTLFVSNHIAQLDAALILSALPGRFKGRLAVAMLGEKLRDWRYPPASTPLYKRLLGRLQYALVVGFFNVFPMPQEGGFRRSFAFAGEVVDKGYNLLVFPEGQRTEDGRMKPFRRGIGMLTEGLNISVVPVKITGLFELKQRRRYFARPRQIEVKFGEPVRYEHGESADFITTDLEKRVANL
jgi:long-chain acyl-CoA synthetase